MSTSGQPHVARWATDSARVSAGRSIPTLYRILVRAQTSRGRLVGLALLAALPVAIAALANESDSPESLVTSMLSTYGIGVFIPLATLLFAAPLFNSLADSRLLVYLWLKPIARWHLPTAALAALVSVVAPMTVASLVAASLVGGQAHLAGVGALAALLATLAYGALYLLFGARFSWGIWLGLAYLLVWENLLAGVGSLGRASIRSYVVTIIGWRSDLHVPLADRAGWAAVVVPIAVAVVCVGLIAGVLSRRDVD